jgi:hypothetical protein
MRHIARLVLAILGVSLAACDVGVTGLEGSLFTLGPPARDLPTGTVRFEPRSLSLRVGETADVTLLVLQWWGDDDFPLVTVAQDFGCEPERSCGLLRYEPAERASLQLQESRAMRIRVTAIAAGRDGVLATVSTCVPAVVFCEDRGTDYLLVEVRP